MLIDRLKKEVYKAHPHLKSYFDSPSYKRSLLIYKRRTQLGLSQQELANRVEVDKRTLVIAETGGDGTTDEVYRNIFSVL